MTMTSIGIEQNGHTAWNAFIEGGAGMINRRQTVRAVDFAGIITEIVEGWAKVNDRDVITILRLVRGAMEVREHCLMDKRVLGVGLDPVRHADPCDPKVTGPEVWQAHDPETPFNSPVVVRRPVSDPHDHDSDQEPYKIHTDGDRALPPRRGPGRPRKERPVSLPADPCDEPKVTRPEFYKP